MRNAVLLFIIMVIFPLFLNGQSQYTAVYRSGEGRIDRSSETVFWVNPLFFRPGVFFSPSEVNLRGNRKWWRDDERLLPKPFMPHGYLPEDLVLEVQIDLTITEIEIPFFSDESVTNRNNRSFLGIEPLTFEPSPIGFPVMDLPKMEHTPIYREDQDKFQLKLTPIRNE